MLGQGDDDARLSPLDLHALWARMVSPTTIHEASPIRLPADDTRLRIRDELRVRYARSWRFGEESVVVMGGNNELWFPLSCEPIVAYALRQRGFRARDVLALPDGAALGRDSILAVLESLLRNGVIEVVPE